MARPGRLGWHGLRMIPRGRDETGGDRTATSRGLSGGAEWCNGAVVRITG